MTDWADAMKKGDSLRPISRHRLEEAAAASVVLLGAQKVAKVWDGDKLTPGTFVVVLTN